MTSQITTLEKCWYVSPPWSKEIPLVEVNLWERVYLTTNKTFGYCCGFQWKRNDWHYFVDSRNEIIHATKHQIIGTGQLEYTSMKKPIFVVGERVMLVGDAPDTRQRLVLGIQLVHRCWFYLVEWMSPVLLPTITPNRFSLLNEKDLVRVKL